MSTGAKSSLSEWRVTDLGEGEKEECVGGNICLDAENRENEVYVYVAELVACLHISAIVLSNKLTSKYFAFEKRGEK